MLMRTLAALAALSFPVVATAQATGSCITAAEGEQFVLAVAPDLIVATGTACAASLPPTALLRQTDGPFLTTYRMASDGAWPKAMAAIAKIAGPEAKALIAQSDLVRPMIGGMLAGELVNKIKPADCVRTNRIVTELAPLPPQNMAAVVIAIVEATQQKRAKPTDRLRLCPAS